MKILGVAVAGLLLILFAARGPRDEGPVQNGRTLSEWLVLISPYNPEFPSHLDNAQIALSAMGTNALPYLANYVSYGEQTNHFRGALRWIMDRVPLLRRSPWLGNWVYVDKQKVRAAAVPRAVRLIGPAAVSLAPKLALISIESRSREVSIRAVDALGAIRPEAIKEFINVVESTNHVARLCAMREIAYYYHPRIQTSEPASPQLTIPAMVRCANGPDPEIAIAAVLILRLLEATNALQEVPPAALTNAVPETVRELIISPLYMRTK